MITINTDVGGKQFADIPEVATKIANSIIGIVYSPGGPSLTATLGAVTSSWTRSTLEGRRVAGKVQVGTLVFTETGVCGLIQSFTPDTGAGTDISNIRTISLVPNQSYAQQAGSWRSLTKSLHNTPFMGVNNIYTADLSSGNYGGSPTPTVGNYIIDAAGRVGYIQGQYGGSTGPWVILTLWVPPSAPTPSAQYEGVHIETPYQLGPSFDNETITVNDGTWSSVIGDNPKPGDWFDTQYGDAGFVRSWTDNGDGTSTFELLCVVNWNQLNYVPQVSPNVHTTTCTIDNNTTDSDYITLQCRDNSNPNPLSNITLMPNQIQLVTQPSNSSQRIISFNNDNRLYNSEYILPDMQTEYTQVRYVDQVSGKYEYYYDLQPASGGTGKRYIHFILVPNGVYGVPSLAVAAITTTTRQTGEIMMITSNNNSPSTPMRITLERVTDGATGLTWRVRGASWFQYKATLDNAPCAFYVVSNTGSIVSAYSGEIYAYLLQQSPGNLTVGVRANYIDTTAIASTLVDTSFPVAVRCIY